jgi:hypothetical protein
VDNQFPIIDVPTDAAEEIEAMGTKYKFWFKHPEFGYCLYKQARPNTGEDWSEKIASELCELLGLPHARYELAIHKEAFGIISPSLVQDDDALVHGNEILAPRVPSYPKFKAFNVSQHTLDIVLAAISDSTVQMPFNWKPLNGVTTAVEVFLGYLLLDAWIGNTDRHHENWGFLAKSREASTSYYLAPTYDHASCLGRELQDSERERRLNENSVHKYVAKCRSALFGQDSDKKAMLTLDAFYDAAKRYPNAAIAWLGRLEGVSTTDTVKLLQRVPSARISKIAIDFAQKVLEMNQHSLLNLREKLP